MSDHVRRQIREAFVALVTGLPTTGPRVHSGRVRPLGSGHEPCLLVYATDESAERATIGRNPLLARTLLVAVEGRVSVASAQAAEDLLDTIAAEIEARVAGSSPRLGGLASDLVLAATRILVTAEGHRHDGEIRLLFRVSYRTRAEAPTVAE
ncbi:hypothetical protein [Rhodoplanes sp. SY1]|uniref:hypothetical protein n=1 Tax=Rhodoplanes sp. SY1 TaxID=3166646 RepID=UPI0038B5412C